MAAEAINKAVEFVVSKRGTCNLMLTGGNTAERLYLHWSSTSTLQMDKIRFSFGDERCVAPDHPESNYALVMRTLPGIPFITRMEAENEDRAMAAKAYARSIPATIDILLLGMGEDGHIASLFPNDPVLNSEQIGVEPITGPKPPYQRLTITPGVIRSARFIFVLATGAGKGKTMDKALQSETDFLSLPIRLASRGAWLLDNDAGDQIRSEFKNNSDLQNFLRERW